jgi:sulfite reductase (NADPH) flavoprotein alpha-component
MARISETRLLSGKSSKKEIKHYEIDLGNSGILYKPGDSLCVVPINNSKLVYSILSRLRVSSKLVPKGFKNNIFNILKKEFEILTPTKRLIQFIGNNISNQKLSNAIQGNDKSELEKLKFGKDILDFLNLDVNLEINVDFFLQLLKPLQHRTYSISSSLNVHPNQVHLTVSTLRWKNEDRYYNGICSTYLADTCSKNSKIHIFTLPNKSFKLPEDNRIPIIMIGPGTGFAPFRAFLEERVISKSIGKNWLFFGGQTKANDFIYENEIMNMKNLGFLNKLDTAFSRDQEKKKYVQHKMYESKREFFKWLQEGAYIYICGEASAMANDVDRMLHKIIREELGSSDETAKEYVKKLKAEKRYLTDVY